MNIFLIYGIKAGTMCRKLIYNITVSQSFIELLIIWIWCVFCWQYANTMTDGFWKEFHMNKSDNPWELMAYVKSSKRGNYQF